MIYKNSGNVVVLNCVKDKGKVVLDVGCGAGDNAKELKKTGKIVDGITLSEKEKEIGLNHMRDVFIFNLENGLPDEIKNRKYDIVICSHVLEHICWPDKLLADVKDVLYDNGYLIIALPNLMHYKSRFKLLRGDFNYTESGIMDKTHFRWYTFQTAQNLLNRNGFKITKAWVDGHLPFYRAAKILPLTIQLYLKKVFFGVSKGLFGEQLFYEAKK